MGRIKTVKVHVDWRASRAWTTPRSPAVGRRHQDGLVWRTNDAERLAIQFDDPSIFVHPGPYVATRRGADTSPVAVLRTTAPLGTAKYSIGASDGSKSVVEDPIIIIQDVAPIDDGGSEFLEWALLVAGVAAATYACFRLKDRYSRNVADLEDNTLGPPRTHE